ncbi:MAG: hypothetical protein LBQ24_06895 [Candidatus Peribacteria bacterium]|jgi:hypothetical protein|nr:hypothetical protein [Candidatus Peribacteria bacterium]
MSSFNNIDNLITIEKKYVWDTENSTNSKKSSKDVITMEIADSLKKDVF